jgi:uncharacterized membrane protein (UPF0127 family)
MKPLVTFAASILISFAGLTACAAQAIEGPQATLPQSPLVIETDHGPVEFVIEMADDPDEVRTGMMFREQIGPNEGMLFDMGRVRDAAFWMQNTLISLDIIFIEEDGTILRIAREAPPLSDDLIYSFGPVRGVLEIGGGQAAKQGLEEGDLVRHPLFGNTQ